MEGWVAPHDLPKFWEQPVETLTDVELLFSTFCRADQERPKGTWGQVWGYPTCYFCGLQYRYSSFAVECHFDPLITKSSCGKDRACRACPYATGHLVSEHKARFMDVQKAIRSRSQVKKKKTSVMPVLLKGRYSTKVEGV